MNTFASIYQGRRVLLTGHTGFKGSWLAQWLKEMGAQVCGLALEPESHPSHWSLLNLDMESNLVDLRDTAMVKFVVDSFEPEIIFHLGAQALVRRSYSDPVGTWASNVMGTVNVLDAARQCPAVRAIVAVTTDKCYENKEWIWAYRENDPLGGYDPYSASKAGAELVIQSYRRSFFSSTQAPLLASARAGNVIGGGDWSEDRLIPDLYRSVAAGEALRIRSPRSTRPWQHVLESLSGYLLLGQYLLQQRQDCADAWNFGPDETGNVPVASVLEQMAIYWSGIKWEVSTKPDLHEAKLLHLDSSKARKQLGWQPVWDVQDGLRATAEWYKAYLEQGDVVSRTQLWQYVAAAKAKGVLWA